MDLLLIIIPAILIMVSQWYINSSYAKYNEYEVESGITGSKAAREILNANGLSDVKIVKIEGTLTDNFNPTNNTISLSNDIYSGSSVAAIAVAAHECGHAIQDKVGYIFLKIRSSLIPLVNFSSFAGYIAIMIGIIFSIANLIWVGIILEMVILLFQLITLPVEFNASKRALKELENIGILSNNELKKSKKVLVAAALTYVASVTSTLLEILRLVLLFGRRRR